MVFRRDHPGGFGFSTLPRVILWLCLGSFSVAAAAGQSKPARPQSPNATAGQLIQQGRDLAAKGRFAEAEVPLQQALQLAPGDDALLTLLGKVEGRLGKQTEAIAILQRVVQAEPQKADAHVNLAIALADAQKFEEALSETSRAISLSPKMLAAHGNRARLLADLHRPEEAEKEFSVAHLLAPNDPGILFYWALLERDRGNLQKQTSLFQQVVRLQPDNLKALMLLAQSLQQESKDTETVAVLHHMLQLQPNSENALYMLSMELRRTNPEEARKLQQEFEAQKHKEADLAQVKSLGNQAYVAANKQDWPEAIRLLKKALESCDDCEVAAALHKNLGLALCSNGNLDEGKQHLEVALKLNPNDPDVVKALDVAAQKR